MVTALGSARQITTWNSSDFRVKFTFCSNREQCEATIFTDVSENVFDQNLGISIQDWDLKKRYQGFESILKLINF